MTSPGGAESDVANANAVSVLLVEDNWRVANAMKAVLEQMGMRVVGPAATTAEAMRLVAEESPNVAIVAINLKRKMTTGLIDELHAHGVRVVLASAYIAPPISKKNVAAFLHKPFTGKEFVTAMHAVVRLIS
jgi:DNA-binding response OmpR family regulator